MLRRALAIFPNYQAALEQLAEHYFLAENFEGTLTVARRAIALYPGRHNSYLLASRASVELGKKDDAIKFLHQASEFAAPYPEIRAMRANFYLQQRDWDTAYKLLLDPEAETQRHACLWTLLVKLAITTGDYDAADAALPIALSTVHDASRERLLRGQIAEARWDLKLAAASYREAASLAPGDGAPHFELARVSLKLLDLKACRFHLGRLIDISASSLRLRGQSLNASQTHVGQILDEFTLDADLLDALRRVRLLPPERQIAPLKEMVAVNPDYTPAAIMLLIAERQAGQLVRAVERPANGAFERIPKRIIQYWDDAVPPPDIAVLMESWKEAHPNFEYIRLDDRTAQVFLESHEMHDVLSAYRRTRQPAQRADLIRLAYLAAKGGVYADADDRCIAALGSFVPPDANFVGYQEDYGTLGNNFLAVVPRHPVICLALQLASEAVNRGDSDVLWLATGPGLLSRAFAQFISRSRSNGSERFDATIFDLGFVARRIGFHCPVLYKKTLRHWSRSSFGRRNRPHNSS
jgi:mannosyltransferase OCH1-like enzyme